MGKDQVKRVSEDEAEKEDPRNKNKGWICCSWQGD